MVLQQEIEKVQNRAARFVTGILKKKKNKLKWESLKRGGETVD